MRSTTSINVILAPILFALLIAGSRPAVAADPAPQPELRNPPAKPGTSDGVVRLPAPPLPPGVKGKRLVGLGSGFFITDDKLVTNFHVVKGCGALSVGNTTEGVEVDAQVFATDEAADLALLSAKPPDVTPAQFRVTLPDDPRDEFAIVGYPEHGLPVLQSELDRITIFQDDLQNGRPRYQFFGPVRRGNSGGPLLDWTGAVIGVAVQKIDTVNVYKNTGIVVDNLGIAIANGTIFSFLKAHDTPFQAAAPGEGLSPDQLLIKAHGFVRQVRCWR